MKKEISLNEIQNIYAAIFQDWHRFQENIKLDPKNLYNLIKLKKTILNEVEQMQETLRNFISSIDGVTINADGTFKIPEDKIVDTNVKLNEMGAIIVEIEYTPIKIISEEQKIPIEVMEALFDFIEVE